MHIKDWLNLFRWPNLLLVALTYLVVLLGLILPGTLPDFRVDEVRMSYIFLIGTLLTTVAGNIINDLFDQQTDQLNKPDKWIIGNKLTVGRAWQLYIGLLVVIIALGLWLWTKSGRIQFLSVYIVVNLLLYSYAKWLKSTVLWGNILISLLVASVAFLPWMAFDESSPVPLDYPYILMPFFGTLAFLSNLIREIIKDAEDMHGDEQVGIQTLATRYGIQTSLRIAGKLSLLILGIVIGYLVLTLIVKQAIPILTMLILSLASILLSILLFRSSRVDRLSLAIKIFMLLGVVSLLFLT